MKAEGKVLPKLWRLQGEFRNRQPDPAPPIDNPVWVNVRVSTADQADDAEEHLRRVRLFCESQGWKIEKGREYSDIGKSGHKGDCPELLRMISNIEDLAPQHRPSRVVFRNIERSGRNEAYFDDFIEYLRYVNVRPIFADQPELDVTTADGRYAAQIQMAGSAHFSRKLKEKMPLATQRSYREGRWPHRPFGPYLAGGPAKETQGIPQLPKPDHPNYQELQLIREGITSISQGQSVDGVWRGLVSRGLKRSRMQFYRLLYHPGMAGQTWLDATNRVILDVRKAPAKTIPGSWEPVVEMSLLKRAAFMIDSRGRAPRNASENAYPLRGLVVCGDCGRKLTAQVVKNRYHYYVGQPSGRRTCAACRRYRSVIDVDAQVAGLLQRVALLLNDDWEVELRRLQRETLAASRQQLDELNQGQLRLASQKRQQLLDRIEEVTSPVTRRGLEERFELAETNLHALEARRDALAQSLASAEGEGFDSLVSFVANFMRAPKWEALTLTERVAVLRLLFPNGVPVGTDQVLTPQISGIAGLYGRSVDSAYQLASPAGFEDLCRAEIRGDSRAA